MIKQATQGSNSNLIQLFLPQSKKVIIQVLVQSKSGGSKDYLDVKKQVKSNPLLTAISVSPPLERIVSGVQEKAIIVIDNV